MSADFDDRYELHLESSPGAHDQRNACKESVAVMRHLREAGTAGRRTR